MQEKDCTTDSHISMQSSTNSLCLKFGLYQTPEKEHYRHKMSTIWMWVHRSSWLAFEKENSFRYDCEETKRSIRSRGGSLKTISKASNLYNWHFQTYKSRQRGLFFQTYSKCSDEQLFSQETRKHPGYRSPLEYKIKNMKKKKKNYYCNYCCNIF